MRRKVKNEDSRPLNPTQPTSVKSSCGRGIQRNAFLTSKNAFLLKNGFLLQHIFQLTFQSLLNELKLNYLDKTLRLYFLDIRNKIGLFVYQNSKVNKIRTTLYVLYINNLLSETKVSKFGGWTFISLF